MAQPSVSYQARGAFSGRLPDRTVQPSSQHLLGQSAPGFGRQVQYPQQQPQPQQQQMYGAYSQYAPGAGFGTGRGQVQGQTGPPLGIEKENNVINDLTDDQKDEINEAFSLFDLDKDRCLDLHEFRIALRALGFVVEKPEALQLMTAHGQPKRGIQRIDTGRRAQPTFHASQMLMQQDAFTRIAAQKMIERDPLDEVQRAFDLFDGEKKDYISLDDLRRVTRELGETSLEDGELQTMIDEFDYEGIGGISKDAFFSICLQ